LKRTTEIFLFISHTTNLLLLKFRCNIFIGVRIIKEMPGSVASGTYCRFRVSYDFFKSTITWAVHVTNQLLLALKARDLLYKSLTLINSAFCLEKAFVHPI